MGFLIGLLDIYGEFGVFRIRKEVLGVKKWEGDKKTFREKRFKRKIRVKEQKRFEAEMDREDACLTENDNWTWNNSSRRSIIIVIFI